MSDSCAVVVGANGAIGQAVVDELLAQARWSKIHAVARRQGNGMAGWQDQGVAFHQVLSTDEQQVAACCRQLQDEDVRLLVCCIGSLHSTDGDQNRMPEKRLEDIRPQALQDYFTINTLAPLNWIKHALPLLKGRQPAHLVVLSARVGSIADNRLGGWYGYRASKAALNMLVKTAQVEYQRRAPNVTLVSYHPGTIDSPLSKPFQANVAKEKLFSPSFTAQCLMQHLPALEAHNGPHFIDWQGQPITW